MFLSRVSSFSKPTGQFFCKFVSQSVKDNRGSLSILSSQCGQRCNSMQIMNIRLLFLSSSRLEESVAITFVRDDGTEVKRQGPIGWSLHGLEQENDDFMCFKANAPCPSCHVILPKEIFDKLEPPTVLEACFLGLAPHYCDNSRLGCCVDITKDMDGMVVRVPSDKD